MSSVKDEKDIGGRRKRRRPGWLKERRWGGDDGLSLLPLSVWRVETACMATDLADKPCHNG